MRKIGVILGSENDLVQCGDGLRALRERTTGNHPDVIVPFVDAISLHRNTDYLFARLRRIPSEREVDVLMLAAGWAAHLPGTADAYFRYQLKNSRLVVYAVAMEDPEDPVHTDAAVLSITEVPGTKVVFRNYVGSDGFHRACLDAMNDELKPILLPAPRNHKEFSLDDAIARSDELKEEIEKKKQEASKK